MLKAIERLARFLPNGAPGKGRLIRKLLETTNGFGHPTRISGLYGLTYEVPDLEESVALNLFCFGVYEPQTLKSLLSELAEHSTLLDGGANIGAITLPIARLRPDVTIIAVEGDPDIANYLRRNAAVNGLSNILVVNCLLGADDATTAAFYKAPEHKFGMGSLGNHFATESITLPQRTVDSLAYEFGKQIDVIKLDIEGAEALALQGASKTLAKSPAPTVIFEYQPWAERAITGTAAGDSQRILRRKGYSLTRIGFPEIALDTILTEGSGMLIAKRHV